MLRCLILPLCLGLATTGLAEHVCRYCQAPAEPAERPAGAPRYAPDRVVDVLHLKIDVTPDFRAKTVHATTTLRFAPIAEPVRMVELDAVDLRLEEVTATRPLEEHSSTGEKLRLLFAEPIPVGEEVEVAITYTAEPKKGLYFRTADMGYPEGEDHLWTQGETHESRHWFPSFDYPNERSTTEVVCRVPEGMTVLSNGRRVGEETDPETGLVAVHWRQEKPHVNYLVCLCAGYFHALEGESSGVPLGFYTQPGFADQAANSFQDTGAILAFYEQEIGVDYPWAKYDQVTIRDFNWGGMENTTLTTLTHRTIYADETENLLSSQNLDAHELAHQWFGDYVTCKDWSHTWLNEGFATYYTHLYAGHKDGRDELLYGLYRDAGKVISQSEKDARPIVYRRYDKAFDQFDFRAYPKGSWVLHMLRSRLGEDLYREAVRRYLERHALGSVVTDDLRQAFEEVSGKPLDAFFDQWLYHGGVPRMTVEHEWLPKEKLLRVSVEQQEPGEDGLLYTFPVTLRVHVGDETVDRRVEVTEREQDFYLTLPGKPDVVRFDPEYTLLAEVEHKQPQAMLEKQLGLKDDLVGRLRAAEALGEKANQKATDALAAALADDAHYGVRVAAAEALAEQGTPEALEKLTAARKQDDARVRKAVVTAIGKFYGDDAAAALSEIAQQEKNPIIRGAAIGALAKYGDDRATDLLTEALQSNTFQNALAIEAAAAVGRLGDPSLGPDLIDTIRTRRADFPGREMGEAIVAVGDVFADADDKAPARELLVELLEDPALSVRLAAIRGLGELGDRRVAPILEDWAGTSAAESGAAEKALKKLDAAPSRAPEAVRKLREELRELREEHEELSEKLERLEAVSEAEG